MNSSKLKIISCDVGFSRWFPWHSLRVNSKFLRHYLCVRKQYGMISQRDSKNDNYTFKLSRPALRASRHTKCRANPSKCVKYIVHGSYQNIILSLTLQPFNPSRSYSARGLYLSTTHLIGWRPPDYLSNVLRLNVPNDAWRDNVTWCMAYTYWLGKPSSPFNHPLFRKADT